MAEDNSEGLIEDIIDYIATYQDESVGKIRRAKIEDIFPEDNIEESVRALFRCLDGYFALTPEKEYHFHYRCHDGQASFGEDSSYNLVRVMEEKQIPDEFGPVTETHSISYPVFSSGVDDSLNLEPTIDEYYGDRRIDKILKKVEQAYDILAAMPQKVFLKL